MGELRRLTTEYIETEDRIRISGELSNGETLVMWISQRLIIRLLPHLFLWLERQTGDAIPIEIAQDFEQKAASASLPKESPVVTDAEANEWLVLAVDLSPETELLRMRYRGSDSLSSDLFLTPVALRQWLAILYPIWLTAEWPVAIWPVWFTDNKPPSSAVFKMDLH